MRARIFRMFCATILLLILNSDSCVVAQNFFRRQWNIFNHILDKIEDSGYDTLYMEMPKYKWGARIKLEVNGENTQIWTPTDTLHLAVEPRAMATLELRYRPFQISFLKIGTGKRSNLNLNYSICGRKWGLDVRYRDVKSMQLEQMEKADIKYKSITASAHYVMRNKRFSYPAATDQSARQICSAGSPIFGISYTYSLTNIDGADEQSLVSLKQVALNMGGLGAGYAQNFVPHENKKWLFHISGMLTWAFVGRNTQTDVEGETLRYNQSLIFNGQAHINFAHKHFTSSLGSTFHTTISGVGATTGSQSQRVNYASQYNSGLSIGSLGIEWWTGVSLGWRW